MCVFKQVRGTNRCVYMQRERGRKTDGDRFRKIARETEKQGDRDIDTERRDNRDKET